MILTCPKCASRFIIAAHALAPEGRKVKCSACGEMWFQLPDPDELIEDLEGGIDIDMADDTSVSVPDEDGAPTEKKSKKKLFGKDDLDDIPDAVKPRPESAEEETKEKPKSLAMPNKAEIATGLILFVILCAPVFLLKDTIIRSWPESIAFYKAVGISSEVPGEGLVFDRITADTKDKRVIIEGQVINLTSKNKILPIIEVALVNELGVVAANWYINPPQGIIKGEEAVEFNASYDLPEVIDVKDIRVRFVLKAKGGVKTASKDDDNTHAQHADDSAAPSADAKASKSPEHGDAPPHQESPHENHNDHH